MNAALLVSANPKWSQASGLGAALGQLGFVFTTDPAGRMQEQIKLMLVDGDSGLPPEGFNGHEGHKARPSCLCLAVVPAGFSADHAALSETAPAAYFDGVLQTPVTLRELAQALARHRYAVLTADACQNLPSTLDALACGDHTVAQDLVHLLLMTDRENLVLLHDALQRQAPDELAEAAHRLNGSLKMLRCTALIKLATCLEQAAHERDFTAAQALLHLLADGMKCLDAALEQLPRNLPA
ncbi:Hpt domain-containing protein [Paraburkholderia bonniea]|uniref:Hpt domain-containing protein n=1 Tax=Paraburkholderia bonniea TaxID=2152891 RepID=UPI0012914F80|nr:Hpt domain-containing protein [Paraburkholderia bonniea]WJF91770.1 Hpt domain-containing protein [Paraburkholderia bonniea]WJF95090.1 Hpt domain-containing protein [Paraburkholderia bonniea]